MTLHTRLLAKRRLRSLCTGGVVMNTDAAVLAITLLIVELLRLLHVYIWGFLFY